MNQITKPNFLFTIIFTVILTALNAQENALFDGSKSQKITILPTESNLSKAGPSDMNVSVNSNSSNKTAMTNCTDKINYVGNNTSFNINVRGTPFNNSPRGIFQVFPSYKGTVTAVEVDASKFNVVNNPTLFIAIFPVTNFGEPDISTQSTPVPLVLNSSLNTSYTVALPTPVIVSGNNGFAVGFYKTSNSTDSARIYTGPIIVGATNFYSYVFYGNSSLDAFPFYFANNLNAFLRPIVTTSVNPSWVSAKTSTGCGIPAVFNFTNTSQPASSYVNDPLISPSGLTRILDYGDGSPSINFNSPVTHSYTTVGNYVANYTQTYVGWTNNCVESLTTAIVVDNPLPSFSYNSNGLTVMFTNTSQNLSSFVWNFGDLSTSTQNSPTHTFSSPGTYVVELEGTAACGKVKFSLSITVSATTGIKENTGINSSVSLFPNPASNLLKITTKSQNEFEAGIEIFNSLGSSVKTITTTSLNSGSTSVDVSDLSKGIYFIKLKTKEGDVVKSFVKE